MLKVFFQLYFQMFFKHEWPMLVFVFMVMILVASQESLAIQYAVVVYLLMKAAQFIVWVLKENNDWRNISRLDALNQIVLVGSMGFSFIQNSTLGFILGTIVSVLLNALFIHLYKVKRKWPASLNSWFEKKVEVNTSQVPEFENSLNLNFYKKTSKNLLYIGVLFAVTLGVYVFNQDFTFANPDEFLKAKVALAILIMYLLYYLVWTVNMIKVGLEIVYLQNNQQTIIK